MRLSPLFRTALGVMLAAAFLAGCGSPPDESAVQDTRDQLVGTWLREYDEDGVKIRRILVLASDGHFAEQSRVTELGVVEVVHNHAGEWTFDGTNLKRRYTSVDGKQPSAPAMPFATFEIHFDSRNEFTGIDRVRRRQVQYARVAEGTAP
jgi:hypothetical protein